MKSLTEFEQVYLYTKAIDMRKGIQGLCDIVTQDESLNLMGKNLFIFCCRRKKRIKILYFDKSGFALWQKLLQTEKFIWPRKFDKPVINFTTQQLEWLLEGFDVTKMKPFRELHYERFS